MPKMKIKPSPFEPLAVLILGKSAASNKSSEYISRVLGISRPTYNSRIKKPQDFKISELQGIAKVLNIPWQELVSKIPEKSY